MNKKAAGNKSFLKSETPTHLKNEASYLREYLKIKAAEQTQQINRLRILIETSSLSMSEAKGFYQLVERMEEERIKV